VTATFAGVVLVASLLIVRLTRHHEVQPPPSSSPTPSQSASSPPPSAGTLRFQGSGLEGGGFENVVAVDPSGSGVLLAGGDVSGFQRSTDWGAHWETANGGITTQSELQVAAIAFSAATPGKVYAGVGWKGRLGGLLVSTDGGQSWTLRSHSPGFSGLGHPRVPGLERPFPRSTGNLLALDEKDGLIYAATYDKGVMRSSDDGKTWTSLGLDGKFLRSIVLDPSDPNSLYVVALGDGVYKTSTAKTSGSFTRLVRAPATPVQLASIGRDLYLVAGKLGVWRSSDMGSTWTQLGMGSVPSNGPFWRSVAGYQACGSTFIFAGSDMGGGKYSIIRSSDGGVSWLQVAADPSHVSTHVGGSSSDRWWLASRREFMLGGKTYTAASIAIAAPSAESGTCGKRPVFVAGASGVWGSTDGGIKWFPAVGKMAVTVARGVAADPRTPGLVYVWLSDWTILESTDGGETFVNNRPQGAPRGYCVALDTSVTPTRVSVGIDLHPGDGKGDVFSSPDPANGSAWSSEELRSLTGGGTPIAIAAQHIDSSPVLLAAVAGGGIWRKASGNWARVNDRVMTRPHMNRGASFAWPQGSPIVYFFDPGTGLWRSADAGQSWKQIWDLSADSSRGGAGYLSADPRNPSRLYLSIEGSGVYRLDNAASGTFGKGGTNPKRLGSFHQAGPMAVDRSGGIFVSEGAAANAPPSLSFSGDLGATWHDVATDEYRRAAFAPVGLAVGPDDRVYVALSGNGMLIGTPVTR
jgi:hypothetical protein